MSIRQELRQSVIEIAKGMYGIDNDQFVLFGPLSIPIDSIVQYSIDWVSALCDIRPHSKSEKAREQKEALRIVKVREYIIKEIMMVLFVNFNSFYQQQHRREKIVDLSNSFVKSYLSICFQIPEKE